MKIIGIVGQQGSGKDTAANYIAKKYGYIHISTGDQIREYIRKHNLGETTRDVIQKVIIELRKKNGPAVIVEHILKDYPNSNLVLSGLRHPAEVQMILDKGGFVIAISAEQAERYSRAKERSRTGDEIDFKAFVTLEAKENGGNPDAFNIGQLVDRADEHVNNNGSYKDFYDQLDAVMASRGNKKA